MGSVIPGSTSGTLLLDSNAYPGGNRTVTGGTMLGGSPTFYLGACTFTGVPNHSWSISGNYSKLTGPGGTINIPSVDFEPSATNTGTFPSSSGSTVTTSTYYLGATASIGTSTTLQAGTYTGTVNIMLTDNSNGTYGSQTFTISLKVDPTPISIANASGLNFGSIIAGTTPGTVVLSPTGTRTATGGAILSNLSPSSPASFNVTGAFNATYSITLPTSTTLTSSTGTLTLGSYTSSPSSLGTLSATGTQQLQVGATLNLAGNQPDGIYSGSFSVLVAYN